MFDLSDQCGSWFQGKELPYLAGVLRYAEPFVMCDILSPGKHQSYGPVKQK
jgi:hypothetical protein